MLDADHPPQRWRLASGVRVVRRGRDRWQVGLEPPRRVVLPAEPWAERVLVSLAERGEVPAGHRAATILSALQHLGLAHPVPRARPVAPRVALDASSAPWPVDAAALLRAAGAAGPTSAGSPDATLLLDHAEPDRARLDPLLRVGRPHLPVVLVDGGVRLGPLVVPGRTACLRCVDLHRSGADPDHLAVQTRYAGAQLRTPPGEGPLPSDPALVALAVAWAVRDLLDHLRRGSGSSRGRSTWSSTLTWHPGSAEPAVRTWLRHPDCGCGWTSYPDPDHVAGRGPCQGSGQGSGHAPSGTMEA